SSRHDRRRGRDGDGPRCLRCEGTPRSLRASSAGGRSRSGSRRRGESSFPPCNHMVNRCGIAIDNARNTFFFSLVRAESCIIRHCGTPVLKPERLSMITRLFRVLTPCFVLFTSVIASAATTEFRVLIDADNSSATGCPVAATASVIEPGIEHVLITTVDTTTNKVTK